MGIFLKLEVILNEMKWTLECLSVIVLWSDLIRREGQNQFNTAGIFAKETRNVNLCP